MEEKIEEIIRYNNKFPQLIKEEVEFFKKRNKDFFKKYNVNWSLQKKIASSLQSLAVNKLIGVNGFEKNKNEAIRHHLKACEYNPCIVRNHPSFRELAGLLVYQSCEELIKK